MLDPTEVVVPEAPEPSEPAGEPVAEAEPTEPASEARSWWGNVWHRLTTPTERKPADYTERRLSRVVNEVLDGRGVAGAAHEAQVGESVSLAVDHAVGAGRAEAQTPLGHLGGSVGEYVYRSWESRPPGGGGDAE